MTRQWSLDQPCRGRHHGRRGRPTGEPLMPDVLAMPPAHLQPHDRQSVLATCLRFRRGCRSSTLAGSAAAIGRRRSSRSVTSLSISARSSRTSCPICASSRSREVTRAARSAGTSCSASNPLGAPRDRPRARSSSSRRVCHDPPPRRMRNCVCVIDTSGRPSATSSSIAARTSSLGKLLSRGSLGLLFIVVSWPRAAGLGGASCRFPSDCSSMHPRRCRGQGL